MSDGKCWGAWLYYDASQNKYYSYYIGFTHDETPSALTPDVPAEYDATFVYEYYDSLHTYYMADYTWYYVATTGALFFLWVPTDAPTKPVTGTTEDVYVFTSYKKYSYNYKDGMTMAGDYVSPVDDGTESNTFGPSITGGFATSIAAGAGAVALSMAALF